MSNNSSNAREFHPEDGARRPEPSEPSAEELRHLGEAVRAREDDVLAETVARTSDSGEAVDGPVQQSFERICTNSTIAVARWIAGDGLEVTYEASRDTSKIFGELAAHRAASLHEVTRRMPLVAQRVGRRDAGVRRRAEGRSRGPLRTLWTCFS